jgi:hypothetical protein
VLYAGRIGLCRRCPLRQPCQEHPSTTQPRRVSAVFWPLPPDPLSAPALLSLLPGPASSSSAPLLWLEWPRRSLRRHWLLLLRRETATFSWGPAGLPEEETQDREPLLTREVRAHDRLAWSQRPARNARPADAPRLSVLLHGLPTHCFETVGFSRQVAADALFSALLQTLPCSADGAPLAVTIILLSLCPFVLQGLHRSYERSVHLSR